MDVIITYITSEIIGKSNKNYIVVFQGFHSEDI